MASVRSLAPFAAPRDARCGPPVAGDLVERTAVVVRAELVDRPTTLFAEVVGQLVRGDREQVGFHVPLVVVMRQAGQEADERLLDHVLAGGAIAEPAVHEGQQPPFESLDELTPRLGIARAHLPDQQGVGLCGCHRFDLPRERKRSRMGSLSPIIVQL
jgi:hypothetical protein